MKKMLRKMIGLSVVMAMVFTLFMPAMVSATFNVKFDLNGGTYTNGMFLKQIGTVTRGSWEYLPEDFIDMELDPKHFKREGYTFKGWATQTEFGIVMNNERLKNFVINNSDVKLYAQWEKNNEPVPQPEPGPAPQPQPQPAPQPEPVPVPQPEPGPAPQPEPVPQPQPEPGPAPQPEPVPQPQPEPAPQHSDSGKREVATLAAPSGNPKTGDPSGNPKTGDVEILLWAGFMAVSMLGLTAVITFLKKVR